MKLFLEYNGEQYGYISFNDDKKLDYFDAQSMFLSVARQAGLLTDELENLFDKLGDELDDKS